MTDEVLVALGSLSGRRVLDATFGRGGHAQAFLESGARVLALDQDPEAVRAGEAMRLSWGGEKFEILHMNFRNMAQLAQKGERFDRVFFDLGVSSPQLDEPRRGFSFQQDGPLDMRMDPSQTTTAADLINGEEERELARIFFEYGDERAARRIAAAVVHERGRSPIQTTLHLSNLISKTVGGRRDRKIHPATKCFQALRIRVNDELKALDEVLPQVLQLLTTGGVFAMISFHALEDRRVKHFIEHHSREEIRGEYYAFGHKNPDYCLKNLGRWKPSMQEISENPRARSARLRAAEKI